MFEASAEYCISQYISAIEKCEPQFMTHCTTQMSPYSPGLMSEIAQRLRQAREAAGYKTAKEFADKNAIPQPTYALHESGGRSLKRGDTLKKYASLLGIRASWLQFGEGPMKDEGHRQLKNSSIANNSKDVASTNQSELEYVRDGHLRFLGPRDLPILGYVKAGQLGFFIENGERQGVTMRPEALRDVAGAYAVRVHDESMSPVLEAGYLLFVDPTRPTKPGDNVVIQMKDGQAFIKRLVRRTEKATICKQFNPASEVKFDPTKVKSVHLVVQISTVDI